MVRLAGIVATACRLRCPRCVKGAMFAGAFKMHLRCPVCDLKFEREQGFFVGAMYINYGVTVAIVLPGYWVLDSYTPMTLAQQLALWVPFAALFPIVFFRHSRSLWLALDYLCNPEES